MRKRTVKVLTGIGIAVVVLGVVYAVGMAVSTAKLRRVYAALQRDSRPIRPVDIIPPDVPDAENAALLYRSAILLLKAQPADQDANQPAGNESLLRRLGDLSGAFLKESLDAEKRAELERLLNQGVVDNALSIVAQGTCCHSCRFDLDYKAGFSMLLPHLAELRPLVLILAAKARLEAQAGRPATAWDLAVTLLRFANALRTEPLLISQLVRVASIRVSCQTIQKICEFAPPSPEQYRSIEGLLSDYDDRGPLVLALDGERILGGEWTFNLLKHESAEALRPFANNESGLGDVLLNLYSFCKPLLLADHAAYLWIMLDYTQSALRPYSPDEARAMDSKIGEMRSHLHVVTAMIVPAIGRVKEVYCEMLAQLRITRAGLAVLQEKKTRGTFPQTLDSLKLKDLNDPFSGGPLHYRPGSNGFVLYSVGPDQKNNNGSPKQKKQKTDWDIVWQFPGGATK
jgi:hypothetical protein